MEIKTIIRRSEERGNPDARNGMGGFGIKTEKAVGVSNSDPEALETQK